MATGLVIAAHGSNTEPEVNDQIRQLTVAIAGLGLFDEVVCAFHQGEPGFAEVMDTMTADTLVVVPLMTSQGYYADTVLPEALATAERFSRVNVHQTSAVGLHPRVAELVRQRCSDLIKRFRLELADAVLVLVGHGTPKHPESRASTLACVDALKSWGVAGDVRPAFLDDEPGIESVAIALAHRDLVVIPFMIGRGLHASADIARRFGMNPSACDEPPVLHEVEGRRMVLDLPIGCHRDIMNVVIDLASDALVHLRKAHA